MKRRRTYLNQKQAEALLAILRRNELLDLLVFINVHTKAKSKNYQLCIDCSDDSYPRIHAKIQDMLPHLAEESHKQALGEVVWYEYDDSEQDIVLKQVTNLTVSSL